MRRGDVFGVCSASRGNSLIAAQAISSQGKPRPGYTSCRTDIRGSAQAFQSCPGVPSDTDIEAAPPPDPYLGSGDDDASGPAWSRPPLTFVQRAVRSGRSIWRQVTDFMTPPLWASVLSLVVALNRPLQHGLEVNLRPIRDAIAQAGDCSIPLTLVVLGAYFHRTPDQSELPPCESDRQQRASLVGSFRKIFSLDGWKEGRGIPFRATRAQNKDEGRTVFVSILARMVITPALLLPLVVFGRLQGYPRVIQEYAPPLS